MLFYETGRELIYAFERKRIGAIKVYGYYTYFRKRFQLEVKFYELGFSERLAVALLHPNRDDVHIISSQSDS